MQSQIELTPYEFYKHIRDYNGYTSELTDYTITITPPGELIATNDVINGLTVEFFLSGAVLNKIYDIQIVAEDTGGPFSTWSRTVRGVNILPSAKQESTIQQGISRSIGLVWDTGDPALDINQLSMTILDLATGVESNLGLSTYGKKDDTNDVYNKQIISFTINANVLAVGTYIVKAFITSSDTFGSKFEFQHTIHVVP